jgi:hypothetical protein
MSLAKKGEGSKVAQPFTKKTLAYASEALVFMRGFFV